MHLFDCAVDGNALSSLPFNIIVYDISDEPIEKTTATPYGIGNGSFFTRSQRESLSVAIRLAVREQDTVRRTAAFAAIQTWARGRILTRSDRPDQELLIDHVAQPVMQSALQWTGYVDVTFTAYTLPYWRGSTPEETTINVAGSVFAPGNAETCTADVVVTVESGTLTELYIVTDKSSITMEGISIPAGESIVIAHDYNGYLSIKHGNTSLLLDRTVDSSDDLLLPCGRSTVSVTGNTSVTATISTRGAWL